MSRPRTADESAVLRCMRGDIDPRDLHPRDREEVVRRLTAKGLTAADIEVATGISVRTVARIRTRLRNAMPDRGQVA